MYEFRETGRNCLTELGAPNYDVVLV